MSWLSKRRERRDAPLERLVAYEVRMDHSGHASVHVTWADEVSADQRRHLEIFATLAFTAQQMYILGSENYIISGFDIPLMALASYSSAGGGSALVDEVEDPTVTFNVELWRKGDDYPLAQTPAEGHDLLLMSSCADAVVVLATFIRRHGRRTGAVLDRALSMLDAMLHEVHPNGRPACRIDHGGDMAVLPLSVIETLVTGGDPVLPASYASGSWRR